MIEKLYRTAGQTVLQAKQRLWLTRTGDLVEDGHPMAALLFCHPGQTLTLQEAEARGLYGGDAGNWGTPPPHPAPIPAPPEIKPIWPGEKKRRR